VEWSLQRLQKVFRLDCRQITVGFNPKKYPNNLDSSGDWDRRESEKVGGFVDFTTTVLHELMHVKNIVETGDSGGLDEWEWNIPLPGGGKLHIRGDQNYYQRQAVDLVSPLYGDIYKWYKKNK
jgi:hypothetical protein